MSGFSVKFWGVRGSVPVAQQSFLRFGGNTSCVEVRAGNRLIILDAGSGLYPLGQTLKDPRIDILLSHTHIDHILGLLFFAPAYERGRELSLWAGHLWPEHTLEKVLDRLMAPPIFPLTQADFKAAMHYRNFRAGEVLDAAHWAPDGITIRTLPLNHPDRATGYRIEHHEKSLCYITDIEHLPDTLDSALVSFLQGADALIYDTTYADEDFAQYKGWGHSTWQQAVRLSQAAGVRQLLMFHHNPEADDATLDERQSQARRIFPAAIAAREGMIVNIE